MRPIVLDEVFGRCHAKGPAKHRNERADVFIAEIEGNGRDSRTRSEHLQRAASDRRVGGEEFAHNIKIHRSVTG